MKYKILSALLTLLLGVSFLLGCSGIRLSEGPSLGAMVTGNGGMVVRKGEYLYFTNGYISIEDLKNGDNRYGGVNHSGIYRAKLNTSGELSYSQEGELENIELLIPKVAGFENGGIYIFDNYIFYATPTTLKDKTGKVRFDLVDFYMAKLDGTSVKKIYATSGYGENAKFSFVKVDQTVYLLVFDGTKVVSVAINGSKVGIPNTVLKDITSVVLPEFSTYNAENNTLQDYEKYLYYTRSLNEELDGTSIELGNVLARVRIGANQEEILLRDNVWNYSLEKIKNASIYYTKYSNNSLSSRHYLRGLTGTSFATAEEIQLTASLHLSMAMLDFENGNNRGVVVATGNQLLHIKDIYSEDGFVVLLEQKVNILFEQGEYVYYSYGDTNTLARINVKTKQVDILSNEEDTLKVDTSIKVDYDGEYIYFLKEHTNKQGTSYYLERVRHLSSTFESEFIGVMQKEHRPDEEEV